MVLGSVVSKYCAKSLFCRKKSKVFFYINEFFDMRGVLSQMKL